MGRANAILNGNDPHWKRKRRPAYIMSSDCIKLRPGAAEDKSFLGFRHTWIKMSEPSTVSLRQAFLDQSHGMDERRPDQSRIRFGDSRPEANFTYPKIRSIQVKGAAFLDQHAYNFSPNLNTLIGGRGTGKSSIVEYLRLSLDRDKLIQGEDPLRNLINIKRTLEPHGTVEITIEKDEKRWQIAYDLATGPRVIHGDPIPDLTRFFPCRILSQREIYVHAENRQARARLLDDLIRSRLDELTRQMEDATRQIKILDERILRKPELENRLQILRTERLDLQGRVERLNALEGPLRTWRQRLAEDAFFRRIEDEHSRLLETVRDAVDVSLSSTTVGSELNAGPNASLIRDVSDKVEEFTGAFREEINAVLEKYSQAVSGLLHGGRVEAWKRAFDLARAQFESLSSELAAQGTDPDSYLHYQKQLQERELTIATTQNELDGLTALESDREHRLQNLRGLWREESETREKIAADLTDSVPLTAQGKPFVRVSVSRFGDDFAFAIYMGRIVKDRRRVSDEDWGAFDIDKHAILPTDSFLASVVTNTPSGTSAAETFLIWVENLRTGKKPNGCPWSASDRRTKALLEWVTPAVAMGSSLWRQPDRVKVELYRQDGTRAGELEERLSVGQRCTAILALLLAQGDEPAILDQPEDDLDNEFVFRELVPLLRRQKEKRQLIVATHNANIPINADAELLIALEARGSQGRVMKIEGKEAIGALDRQPVRLAAEEILEGSEEAFRRRFEKYGF